jgi:hypothetical protein
MVASAFNSEMNVRVISVISYWRVWRPVTKVPGFLFLSAGGRGSQVGRRPRLFHRRRDQVWRPKPSRVPSRNEMPPVPVITGLFAR